MNVAEVDEQRSQFNQLGKLFDAQVVVPSKRKNNVLFDDIDHVRILLSFFFSFDYFVEHSLELVENWNAPFLFFIYDSGEKAIYVALLVQKQSEFFMPLVCFINF